MLLSERARGRKSGRPPLFAPSFKVQRNAAHNRNSGFAVAPGLRPQRARASKGPAGKSAAPIGLSSFNGRFGYGRIVHWKADKPKRILGTCQNPSWVIIDPVNAARFMTAANISSRRARSAALNVPCVAKSSRIGTRLGFLDIGSLPVQLRNPNDRPTPNALGIPLLAKIC
jgi:hypothetical protein